MRRLAADAADAATDAADAAGSGGGGGGRGQVLKQPSRGLGGDPIQGQETVRSLVRVVTGGDRWSLRVTSAVRFVNRKCCEALTHKQHEHATVTPCV